MGPILYVIVTAKHGSCNYIQVDAEIFGRRNFSPILPVGIVGENFFHTVKIWTH